MAKLEEILAQGESSTLITPQPAPTTNTDSKAEESKREETKTQAESYLPPPTCTGSLTPMLTCPPTCIS